MILLSFLRWDTSLGPIIFEKLNREITTKLPSVNVYGMGENMHKSFRHDLNYRNWPVFARDQIAEDVSYCIYSPLLQMSTTNLLQITMNFEFYACSVPEMYSMVRIIFMKIGSILWYSG